MSTFVPEGLRKQREFLHRQFSMQQPCWACGVPSNQFEATENNEPETFKCPSCEVPMAVSMPLVAVGPCIWYWSRPEGLIVTNTEWRRS